jgi:hypothetical protein
MYAIIESVQLHAARRILGFDHGRKYPDIDVKSIASRASERNSGTGNWVGHQR